MSGLIRRTLNSIDWDFVIPRKGYVGPPHWYPGTFVPALSDALIEALSPDGGVVFDPYSGIGTSGWSAIRTGRSYHITDINPVAILVGYVTTSLLSLRRADKHGAYSALSALGSLVEWEYDLLGAESHSSPDLDRTVEALCAPSPAVLLQQLRHGPPQWGMLATWVEQETMVELGVLLSRVDQLESAYLRLLGLAMISAIARTVGSQHASWGHIADNVRPREMKAQSVRIAAMRWLKKTRAFIDLPMIQSCAAMAPRSSVHMRNWSVAGEPGPGTADVLITSPPYADAIDYTLAQRLSLYILGYTDEGILKLVAGEIGARRKRFKSDSRTNWSDQLCTALTEQVTWLKPRSSICLVLPHKDSGRSVGEEGLKTTVKQLGWHLFFERDRSINQSHTRQSWTSIKKETIIVFIRE